MTKLNWARQACLVFFCCAATAVTLPAQTFTSLFSFDAKDGAIPNAPLVQGIDGNFFGTTVEGGTTVRGTVFSITPGGALTKLYNFCFQHNKNGYCAGGANPYAPLVQGIDGNFYGTTLDGGAYNAGAIFKITPIGMLTTLYSFCSQGGCDHGSSPETGLVQATNGNLYGTTYLGGTGLNCRCGTIFEITPSGKLTTLHSFEGTDGGNPTAPLIQATDGNLYGTTYLDGANGYGTVFKITPAGKLTTLYSFCSQSGCTDGYSANGLVQATDGNLYGTTYAGGANGGGGTVFRITPSGTLTTLYSFCSQPNCTDGEGPLGALIQATDGNFYGTTFLGRGTVFEITPTGALTTLYSFCSQRHCTDGSAPEAGLVQATDGKFFGTTSAGGANGDSCLRLNGRRYAGCGTVFSLAVGLGPFVEARPNYGKVGAAVEILGTDLTGASSVTFNGTAATFTVGSASVITTTVPSGATTGKVEVTTPSGTLTSNVPFRVTQ